MAGEIISKGDRDALLIVLRKRDKAMRAIAAQTKAKNMAEFERLISNEVHWQEDGTSWSWVTRGENAIKERRAELRLMAKARFDAQEKEAIAQAEMHSLDVQQKLIANTLTSDEARAFLDGIQTVESLMPPMNEDEVKELFDQKPAPEIKRLVERQRYDA